MPSFLEEWRDANSHRNFPLVDEAMAKDASGTFRIPPSFMVDLRLDLPHTVDAAEVAVTRIRVSGASATVFISYMGGGSPLVVGSFTAVDGEFGTEAQITGSNAGGEWEGVSGMMAFGRVASVLESPGDWDIPAENAMVNPACVRIGPSGVRALVVDGTSLYGDVVLRPGPNVSITRTTGPGGEDILTFGSAPPSAVNTLLSDDDVFDALVAEFGEPIRTINNIPSDVAGNFNIFGVDCVDVTPGAGAVTVSNPCASPCCDPSEYIGGLYTALDDLNARFARLLQFEEAIIENINLMQNKLGVLHMALQRE